MVQDILDWYPGPRYQSNDIHDSNGHLILSDNWVCYVLISIDRDWNKHAMNS